MKIQNQLAKKTQLSFEFMFLLGIMLAFAIVIIIQQLLNAKDIYSKRVSELVYDAALKLQEEIRTASLVEDGYSRNFSIPSKLDNIDYEIIVSGKFLTVKTNSTDYTVRIPNITGSIGKGPNTINKSGGVVYISQYS